MAYNGRNGPSGAECWTARWPPRYPNLWRNPPAQVTLSVPAAPARDPQRGPASPRHKPWFQAVMAPTRFDWVGLEASLQWRAFQRMVRLLRARGNDVMVVLGPFNVHTIAEDNREPYHKITDGIAAWLTTNGVPYVAPATLPSALYADASHPLTAGYALAARNIYAQPAFQRWLNAPPGRP